MLSFIEGIIEEAAPLSVVLNCSGLGYKVDIPVTTAEKLPSLGKSVRLHVHPVYREDSQSLYGFIHKEDRDFFRLVTEKVSGIGPRIALNLMSRLSLPMLLQAISQSDTALIAKCPGIGKKTAERLCIELRDKLPATSVSFSTPASSGSGSAITNSPNEAVSAFQDAVQALITLGYKPDAADKAVRTVNAKFTDQPPTADQLIKAALKSS